MNHAENPIRRRAPRALLALLLGGLGALPAAAVAGPADAAAPTTIRCLSRDNNPIKPGEVPIDYTLVPPAQCPQTPVFGTVNAAIVTNARDGLAFCTTFLGSLFGVDVRTTGLVFHPPPEWVNTPSCGKPGGAQFANTSMLQSVAAIPRISAVSAASYTSPLAPGMAVVAFGSNLSAASQSAAGGTCTTELGRTRVYVGDLGVTRVSCLSFASPGQVNFELPPLTPPGTSDRLVLVFRRDQRRFVGFTGPSIASVAPGVFTQSQNGQGRPAAYVLRVRADNTQVTENVNDPIVVGRPGERVFLVLYATGLRRVQRPSDVTAVIAGRLATASFVGPSDFLGVDQVNLELPASLTAVHGDVVLSLRAGGAAALPVTITLA